MNNDASKTDFVNNGGLVDTGVIPKAFKGWEVVFKHGIIFFFLLKA